MVSGAFYVVLGMSLVLGLGTGLLLSRTLLNRLDAVTRTAEAINAGDLTRRIARTGTGDDFDRLSATLNAMLDRICALMESVRQVSNDVAHDLRTPLARLRQTLEDAARNSRTMTDYDVAVAKAMAEADGLLATFSALLRISQIEAGARRSAFQVVDLADIMQTVCDAYAPTIEDGEAHSMSACPRASWSRGPRVADAAVRQPSGERDWPHAGRNGDKGRVGARRRRSIRAGRRVGCGSGHPRRGTGKGPAALP